MASRTLWSRAYQGVQWVQGHVAETVCIGAAGGCAFTAALYARGRQRALDHARRNFTNKSNPQSANAVANATEAEAVSVSRNAAAATATKAVQRGSNRLYSPTEKFALALWHG
jgi:hypothetical protein